MKKIYSLLLVLCSTVYATPLSIDRNFIATYKGTLRKELLAAKILRYSTAGGTLAFLSVMTYKYFLSDNGQALDTLATQVPADSIDPNDLLTRLVSLETLVTTLKEKLGGGWISYLQNTALSIGVSMATGHVINFIFHDISITWFLEHKTSVRKLFQELKLNTEILDNPREPEFKKLFAQNAVDQIIRSLVLELEKTFAYMQLKAESVCQPEHVTYLEQVAAYCEHCFTDFLQDYDQAKEYGPLVTGFEQSLNQSLMRFAQLEQLDE